MGKLLASVQAGMMSKKQKAHLEEPSSNFEDFKDFGDLQDDDEDVTFFKYVRNGNVLKAQKNTKNTLQEQWPWSHTEQEMKSKI